MINKANNESVRTSLVSDNVKYLKESEFKSNDRLTKKVNK